MFKKRLDLLLPSYVNEAIVDGAPVNIKKEKVEAYANNLLADERTQEKFLKKNGKLLKLERGKCTFPHTKINANTALREHH